MASVLHFESTACSRCGGLGNIPHYGHVYNGVCFKCHGAGRMLTPKGKSARKLFDELITEATDRKPAWDVAIGERIQVRPGKFARVIGKSFTSRSGAVIDGMCLGSAVLETKSSSIHFTPDSLVGIAPSSERRNEIIREVVKRRSGATLVDTPEPALATA